MKVNWEGIYPAVTTKFTAEGGLDRSGFENNILAQIEAGVDAIVLGGTLGEASALSNEEKLKLTDWAVDIVDGRIPVILNHPSCPNSRGPSCRPWCEWFDDASPDAVQSRQS
jgi:1-pyrroline-4-hydroxy-2-carboxylate deaminase